MNGQVDPKEIALIAEAIEGLPASRDPYNPAQRDDVGDIDTDIAADESMPPDEPMPPDDQPMPGEEGKEDDLGLEPEMPDEGTKDEPDQTELQDQVNMPGPEAIENAIDDGMPFWEPMEVPNKKDLAFQRSDGFVLRARPLTSVPGKWVAQLYTGQKVIDKGMLFVPPDVDPTEYLQKMSDYMLDKDSNRFNQQPVPEEPLASVTPEAPIPEPEEPLAAGAEEDIGLDDENFEFNLE